MKTLEREKSQMKADIKVRVAVSDGKRNVMAEVDGIYMKPSGIKFFWTWGVKGGKNEEEPVAFTKIDAPNLKKMKDGYYLLEGLVHWENLEEIGL